MQLLSFLLFAITVLAQQPYRFNSGDRVILIHDDETCVSISNNGPSLFQTTCVAQSPARYTEREAFTVVIENGKVAFMSHDKRYMKRHTSLYNGEDRYPICFESNKCPRAFWNYDYDGEHVKLSCDGGYQLARCPRCQWGNGLMYDAAVKSVLGNCNRFRVMPYGVRSDYGSRSDSGYGPRSDVGYGARPSSSYGARPSSSYGSRPSSDYAGDDYGSRDYSPRSNYDSPRYSGQDYGDRMDSRGSRDYGSGADYGRNADYGRRDYGRRDSYENGNEEAEAVQAEAESE